MAHLLMIDSWVGGNGVILPHLLKELGQPTPLSHEIGRIITAISVLKSTL